MAIIEHRVLRPEPTGPVAALLLFASAVTQADPTERALARCQQLP